MLFLASFALAASLLLLPVQCDPNNVCMELEEHRNHKDVYPKPGDCHAYYQCYYSSNTAALGFVRECAEGTFFDEVQLDCVQEGPVPCTRLNEISSDRGRINEITCRDTFGNILHAVEDRRDLFRLADITLPCPNGRIFDLDLCQCENVDNQPITFTNKKQCQLWLPFDNDLLDHSAEKFHTFPTGDSSLDTTNFVNGEGSLRVNHGRLRIQGMKAFDLVNLGEPNTASWCFFFRCDSARGHDCLHEGGIISNSKEQSMSEFTVIVAVRPNNKLEVRLGTTPKITTAVIPINWKLADWNHVCVVLDNFMMNVYLNTELVSSLPINGEMKPNQQPYTIGTDRTYGNFIGNIDDVIACAHPVSPSDIRLMYNGDHDALRAEGLFP